MRSGAWAFAAACGLAACTDATLDDNRFQTGSSSLTASSDYDALYVTNVEQGTISHVDLQTKAVQEIAVGEEPTRIARANDRVFVTLRSERKVAVLQETESGLNLETTIDVGAEPFGVVAREDGERIYVASSQSLRVDEIDAEGLTILRSWDIPSEPRWLALHPSNETLYVASPYGNELFYISLGEEDVVKSVVLPIGEIPSGATGPFGPTAVPYTARSTGDPSVTATGREVVMPTLYVDNETPVDDTRQPPPGQAYYGPPSGAVQTGGRFNAAVAVLPVDNYGTPFEEYGFLIQMSNPEVAGYPVSATVDPKSETLYVTVEGGSGLVTAEFDRGSANNESALEKALSGGSASSGFGLYPLSAVKTVEGPRGIAFTDDQEAWVHGFLDYSVQRVQRAATTRVRVVTESRLSPEVELGRNLFYSNDDTSMALPSSGLSCATCHFDGRTDGITWNFTKGPRQTPSLAGEVSATEPVRWEGDRITVEVDAQRTSEDAMGGQNLSDSDLNAIARFVDYTRDVDTDAYDAEAALRGKAIFERPDTKCATCHVGARFTDNTGYTMFGIRDVQTRSLKNLASSAPYLHDGTAATLEEVVDRSRDGISMGDTSMLTEAEARDLVEYLKSL